jgi:PEP-CTERM motif
MKAPLRTSICSLLCVSAVPAFAASISWTRSPAVLTSEINNTGTQQFAYAFNTSLTGTTTLNGVPFLYVTNEGLQMSAANALTPGFQRFPDTNTSHTEADATFYQGPNPELNQILDGLTWGGNTQFQLNNLTPGTQYLVQVFSSDDRPTQVARVLDLDSSWATPNGSRQVEDVDYTAGGPWTDPGTRSKIFTGTFTADAASQQILAEINGTGGQTDLNAIQLRVVPEPGTASLLLGTVGLLGLWSGRRKR